MFKKKEFDIVSFLFYPEIDHQKQEKKDHYGLILILFYIAINLGKCFCICVFLIRCDWHIYEPLFPICQKNVNSIGEVTGWRHWPLGYSIPLAVLNVFAFETVGLAAYTYVGFATQPIFSGMVMVRALR